MKYMMFVATDTEPDTDPAPETEIDDWFAQIKDRWVMGERLRPLSDATTVRVRSGDLLITDGPFTESKEWIVGYDLLECQDIDQAIDYVSRHPMARHGRIEIRPVLTDGG